MWTQEGFRGAMTMLVGLVAWLPGWLVGWPPKFKREITTHVPGGGQARLLNG